MTADGGVLTFLADVKLEGLIRVIGGAWAPLTGRRMVSTDSDLSSIVVPFDGRRGELSCPDLRILKEVVPSFVPSR